MPAEEEYDAPGRPRYASAGGASSAGGLPEALDRAFPDAGCAACQRDAAPPPELRNTEAGRPACQEQPMPAGEEPKPPDDAMLIGGPPPARSKL